MKLPTLRTFCASCQLYHYIYNVYTLHKSTSPTHTERDYSTLLCQQQHSPLVNFGTSTSVGRFNWPYIVKHLTVSIGANKKSRCILHGTTHHRNAARIITHIHCRNHRRFTIRKTTATGHGKNALNRWRIFPCQWRGYRECKGLIRDFVSDVATLAVSGVSFCLTSVAERLGDGLDPRRPTMLTAETFDIRNSLWIFPRWRQNREPNQFHQLHGIL